MCRLTRYSEAQCVRVWLGDGGRWQPVRLPRPSREPSACRGRRRPLRDRRRYRRPSLDRSTEPAGRHARCRSDPGGFDVDGIVGPLTWAALPSDAQMPLLRLGSQENPVAGLQRILTQQAPGRWAVSPEAVTGVFDAATSAAVQASQRWSGNTANGCRRSCNSPALRG